MNDQERAASGAHGRGFPWVTLFIGALWTWAIWSCAEHWRGNPNYSYGWAVPILAIGFGFRRYFLVQGNFEPFRGGLDGGLALGMAVILGVLGFGLEYAREAMWHPVINLWTICLLCTGLTLAVFYRCGGAALARAEAFPTLFFLTAVPWPPRFEQPLTGTLMRSVAAVTTEVLHWWGIEAQASGGAIALRSGLVGITEACSGIRSLQAGIMFGLAMGEWFLLRPGRRIFLLAMAVALALASNLARTLTLALQAERHGANTIEQVHDLVGNVTMTGLILAIWAAGKLLAQRKDEAPFFSTGLKERARLFLLGLTTQRGAAFAVAVVALVAGIFGARLVYARAEGSVYLQSAPRFIAQTDPSTSNRLAEVPHEVWKELNPTSGEYVQHNDPNSGASVGNCFHFFWKPSVWNRFVLVHRPDICMPGVGWQMAGAAEPLEVTLDGQAVRFYLFRFRRGNTHALELWGAWRNGEPVPLDYTAAQALGAAPPPSSLNLEGKRRSATEIVACSLVSEAGEPSREIAVALLQSVFHYRVDE